MYIVKSPSVLVISGLFHNRGMSKPGKWACQKNAFTVEVPGVFVFCSSNCMVNGGGTFLRIKTGLSGQILERPRKYTPNSLSERLSNSTIDYKVDRGIENQK